MSAHGSGSNKAAVGVVLQLLSIDICSLLLLASPDVGSRPGAVESSIEIGIDNVSVVIELTLGHGTLGPWDSGVGDEDVETAVELLDDGSYGFFDRFRILDVDLVCLAYQPHEPRLAMYPCNVHRKRIPTYI